MLLVLLRAISYKDFPCMKQPLNILVPNIITKIKRGPPHLFCNQTNAAVGLPIDYVLLHSPTFVL